MQFGDIKGVLQAMLTQLRQIADHTNDSGCCTAVTSAGTGSIPEGFSSVAIVLTSASGTADIVMSDTSVFTLMVQGESFVDVAGPGKKLPAYVITTSDGGTWQWHGIK